VYAALAASTTEGDASRATEAAFAFAALSEGAFASEGGGDGFVPETYLVSPAVPGVLHALATAAGLCDDGSGDHSSDAAGGGGYASWSGARAPGRPGETLVPGAVERGCIEAIARILCSCALDCREVAAEAGARAGARAAEIGQRASERLQVMAAVAGGGGGGIRVTADSDLLGALEWAVSCVHSVVLGGGGSADLMRAACELGLSAAAAFCAAVIGATDADQDQLADAATTALRLTALVLREVILDCFNTTHRTCFVARVFLLRCSNPSTHPPTLTSTHPPPS
jgi:hypothetical protein